MNQRRTFIFLSALVLMFIMSTISPLSQSLTAAPNYQQHIRPILQFNCVKCHGKNVKDGSLDLSSYAGVLAGGDSGPVVLAGRVQSSLLYQSVAHFENAAPMPPKSKRLSRKNLLQIANWIQGGLLEKPFAKSED